MIVSCEHSSQAHRECRTRGAATHYARAGVCTRLLTSRAAGPPEDVADGTFMPFFSARTRELARRGFCLCVCSRCRAEVKHGEIQLVDREYCF
jgi:hypothetical protein